LLFEEPVIHLMKYMFGDITPCVATEIFNGTFNKTSGRKYILHYMVISRSSAASSRTKSLVNYFLSWNVLNEMPHFVQRDLQLFRRS